MTCHGHFLSCAHFRPAACELWSFSGVAPVLAVPLSILVLVSAQPGPPVSTSCDSTICGHGTRCQMVELSTCHDDVCPLVPRCIQVLCDTSCDFCPPELNCVLVDTGCCPNPHRQNKANIAAATYHKQPFSLLMTILDLLYVQ